MLMKITTMVPTIAPTAGSSPNNSAISAAEARAENRKILIYPEGHLAPVGKKYKYRSGVWHMYRDFDMPVVPLATNLGLCWPEERYEKHPGTATLDFLEPIPTGLPRDEFLTRLETAIETRTAELVAEEFGMAVKRVSESDIETGFLGEADDAALHAIIVQHGFQHPGVDGLVAAAGQVVGQRPQLREAAVEGADVAAQVDTSRLDRALAHAEDSGAVVIAASGNASSGSCEMGDRVFPADSPTVLSVSAQAD